LAETTIRNLLYKIPKTEIHLHLEGLASVETVWNLMQKYALVLPGIKTKADLTKRFQVTSLDDFIDLFINIIQNSFHEVEDIHLLIDDLGKYLDENNICYAEVFFAPSKFLTNGFDFQDMIAILETGSRKIFEKEKRKVRFIIDVSRTSGVENAKKNLDLTIKYKTDNIIGIGLGGAEVKGPAKQFQDVFKKAKTSNLHLVAHAGEVVGPESIWDAIHLLHASRIGHGISAIFDEKLMDYLKEKQIPLEICPTSNLFTKKYFSTLKDHPIREFFDRGLFVTVNTDDPSIFGKNLVDEYTALYVEKIFNQTELFQLIKNNLFATFMPEKEKEELWAEAESIIASS
jgi:adenosine deaminase